VAQSAFFYKKAVEYGKCIFVVGFCSTGFVQFGFSAVNFIGCEN
jgi:hypothetical protein